jgi:hypothetical protein
MTLSLFTIVYYHCKDILAMLYQTDIKYVIVLVL